MVVGGCRLVVAVVDVYLKSLRMVLRCAKGVVVVGCEVAVNGCGVDFGDWCVD